jgi:hypothetical protein
MLCRCNNTWNRNLGRSPRTGAHRRRRYSGDVTSPNTPRQPQPVDYKGEPLDAGRGPGLGCFWIQMIVLAASIIFTPLTVTWGWPIWVTIASFVVTMMLLLLTGQTMIFLLRIVAASRSEGRRRPLAGASPTVGEIDDAAPPADDAPGESAPADPDAPAPAGAAPGALPFEASDEVARAAGAYAEDLVDLAASRYELSLDYSVDSVRAVDRQIADDMYRTRPRDWDADPKRREQLEQFGKALGSYVGEVIRRHHGGEWGWSRGEASERAYAMRLGEGLLWPMARGIKRLTNGSEDDLYAYIVLLVPSESHRTAPLRFGADTTGDDAPGVRQ